MGLLQLILNAGLIQIVGITPTLILVQVALGRSAHVEANSRSPTDIETRKIRNNQISFRVSTVQSTTSGPFSTDPEIPVDTMLRPSLINDAGCPSPKEMRVAQDHDHAADYQQCKVDVVEVEVRQSKEKGRYHDHGVLDIGALEKEPVSSTCMQERW